MARTEPKVENLPKWAQRHIKLLERNLDYAEAKLARGPEDSDTFADPYAKNPRPLGKSTTIQFTYGEGIEDYFQARLDTDAYGVPYLYVTGGNAIRVQPQAANVISVYRPERS